MKHVAWLLREPLLYVLKIHLWPMVADYELCIGVVFCDRERQLYPDSSHLEKTKATPKDGPSCSKYFP